MKSNQLSWLGQQNIIYSASINSGKSEINRLPLYQVLLIWALDFRTNPLHEHMASFGGSIQDWEGIIT